MLLAVIEHGMNDAPVMCKHTVLDVYDGLEAVGDKLWSHLQFHRQTLEPSATEVRNTIILVINAAHDDAMHTLAVESVDV